MKLLKRIFKLAAIALAVLVALALVVPYLIPVPAYEPAAVTSPYTNGRFIEIDGVRLHYRTWSGAGEPRGNVCLIHGFCGSTYSWEETAPWMAGEGYNVVAVDLPAFGYSDRRPGIVHSNSHRAALVWSLLDGLGEEWGLGPDATWTLMGHSMGGRVIGAMAQLGPDQTDRLIFVDATYGPRNPGGPGLMGALLTFGPLQRWVEIIAARTQFTAPNIEALLTSAMGQTPSEETVQAYLAALQVPRTASAILDQFAADEPFHHNPQAITAPALLIWGADDTWVPLQAGKRLESDLPNARLETIEGAGHNPMETHPEAFRKLVLAFLAADQGL